MKVNLLLIVNLAFFVACQKSTENNVKQNAVAASAVKSECTITPKFNANDSVGEFTGLIKRFEDTSEVESMCHAVLFDGSGDSIEFLVSYCQVGALIKEK